MAPTVRCLGINEQVAQKLYACTGPQREDRARDVLDILLVDMLGHLDYARARAAAERIFADGTRTAFLPDSHCRQHGERNWRAWRWNWDTAPGMERGLKRSLRPWCKRLQRLPAH
jgi:hypothetical protein